MRPVATPQLCSHLFVPIERSRTEVEPGIHAHAEKHMHLQPIGFGQDRFEWIVSSNLCTAWEQLGWIVRESLVTCGRDGVLAIVFLIAKTLLDHHRIHPDAMHTINLFAPIGFG